MIRLDRIRYAYSGSGETLKDLHLTVSQGEYLAVFGPNGSGKSTLAYLLSGLIPRFFEGTFQGTAEICSMDVRQLGPAGLFPAVGLVLQNTEAQLFNGTVGKEIAYGLKGLGLSQQQISQRMNQISRQYRITHLLDRSPADLSGGEKRLVAVAAVLAVEPKLIILDEPFAHLDWEGTQRLREALQAVHQKGTTLVVVEQLLTGFLSDATRCLVLEEGVLQFDGPAREARREIDRHRLSPRYPTFVHGPVAAPIPQLIVRHLHGRTGGKTVLHGICFELRTGRRWRL